MRLLSIVVLAALSIGCMSATRSREVQCLGRLLIDLSQSDDEMEAIKETWRAHEYAAANRSIPARAPPTQFQHPSSEIEMPVSGAMSAKDAKTDALYRQLTEARARHDHAQAWYARVARRVETRFEEDEILYGVLSAFVTTPTSLIFYPIVRWNVRSVLWDGADPDADDDPIQQFCTSAFHDRG